MKPKDQYYKTIDINEDILIDEDILITEDILEWVATIAESARISDIKN